MRRSTQGMTRPYICRGDDGHVYFVKGVGAGRRSQLCEWIAGSLALEIGLPVAPFEIVHVPDELIELEAGLDLGDLGIGPAFASRECGVSELSFSRVKGCAERAAAAGAGFRLVDSQRRPHTDSQGWQSEPVLG